MNKKMNTGMILVNPRKAFDTLDQARLFEKTTYSGF